MELFELEMLEKYLTVYSRMSLDSLKNRASLIQMYRQDLAEIKLQ